MTMVHTRYGADITGYIRGFALMLAAVVFMAAGNAYCADDTPELKAVNVTGYAVISGGNSLVARDAAISDALRKAVEQSVGLLVSSETLVQDYQVLNDNVYTKTQGYVRNYNIVREGQLQDTYQVTVNATVALGAIKNDLDALGLLMTKAEKPRVLFLVTEKGLGLDNDTLRVLGGDEADIPAAESSMKEVFLNKGFQVVDISASPDVSDGDQSSSGLSRNKARKIGRALNAELVVKGRSVITQGMKLAGSDVGSFMADISADVIRVDDGTVLASAKGHGVARNISAASGGADASGRAASELSAKLIEQIIAKWTRGNIITIKIMGLTNYTMAADFKNLLKKQVRGVENIYQRRFDDGTAVYDLDVKVSAQQIADDLARIPGGRIKILSTSPNTVDAVMQ